MSGRHTTPSSVYDEAAVRADLRAVLVLEQTLGHVTHGKNLQQLLPLVDDFAPTFVPVAFEANDWRARIPGFSNWTIRAGIRARRNVRRLRPSVPYDALVVHTQVPAVLLGRVLGDIPTVVSLDATPKQYDSLGEHYAHDVGPAIVERLKTWLNRRCFDQADHLITWTQWTKQSLIDDYGIGGSKITVIPPGVDTERWLHNRTSETSPVAEVASPDDAGITRILFVGGDLSRKGGHHLLVAFAELRQLYGDAVELHMVTTSPVEAADGVTVYDSMTSNSPELIALYHQCHVFCLPTLGDCLPMVLAEAGAAGLALIATDVGAISDIVRDQETGLLVPVSDVEALREALVQLIADVPLRKKLASNGRKLVLDQHDAAVNAGRLVDVVRDVVSSAAASNSIAIRP